jgi:hypothetical protein
MYITYFFLYYLHQPCLRTCNLQALHGNCTHGNKKWCEDMAQSILLPTGSWKPRVWIDSWISNRHDDVVDGCLHNRQSLSYVSAVTDVIVSYVLLLSQE